MLTDLLLALLVLAGGYVVTLNWMGMLANWRNAREGIDRHHSLAPLAGPLLLTVGLANLVPGLGWLLLAPKLLDPGTWILVRSLPFLARETL